MSTDPGKSIHTVLDRVRIAPPQAVRSLTIWPLICDRLAPRLGGFRIATLAQALEDGFVSVDEYGDSPEGSVSGVRVVRIGNRACDPLLIIFSEELRVESGALIAEASVLLPPTSELEIGVHPVDLRCAEFHRAGPHREPGSHSSTSAHSPTGRSSEFDEFREGFPPVERQVGFVAAIAGEIVGLELMSDAEIFARSFETLLRRYVLNACEVGYGRQRAAAGLYPLFVSPEPFLAALATSCSVASPTPGLGRVLRVAGRGLAGRALEVGDIVHLTAYPLEVDRAA